MNPRDEMIDVGVALHVRAWEPVAPNGAAPFLLVHGLASNARTWDDVARRLAAAGHPVVAVNQRGHGWSAKPDDGYDFATVAADLRALIDRLGWQQPVIAGQSWGGNVALAFGAAYPGVARRLVFVDGGFLDLQQRGSSWEQIARELAPPNLLGTPAAQMEAWLRDAHPRWSEDGIAGALGNFEILDDETVRPWLTRERHMRILRALWEQRPTVLYGAVREPVLLCVADDGSDWTARKRAQVAQAAAGLAQAEVVWFPATHHDIHIDRPDELAALLLSRVSAESRPTHSAADSA